MAMREETNTASLVSAATAKEQVLGRLEHYAKSRNSLGYYGPGDSFIDQGVVVALTQLLDALESTSRALSEKEGELAERSKEVLAAQGQADDNYQRYIEATRQRDEALATLSAVSAAIGTVRFMDPPDGGDVSLAEQVRRMSAALKASEERVAEQARVVRLYCNHDKLTDRLKLGALVNHPYFAASQNLADATKKDPGTEQREAGV